MTVMEIEMVDTAGIKRVRARVPDAIEAELKWWRAGEARLPQSYIDFQERLARHDLKKKQDRGLWEVHATYMRGDGWGDGMKFVGAIVETKDGALHKVRWADDQSWFRDTGHSFRWALFTYNDFTETESFD